MSNIVYGGNTALIRLFDALQDNLSKSDENISTMEPKFGSLRVGDISHSQASFLKAKTILNYEPTYNARSGFQIAAEWFYKNLI